MLRARIEDNMARKGLLYPWWLPIVSVGGQLGCVLLGLLVRHHVAHPSALVVLVVLLPAVVQIGLRRLLPLWVEALAMGAVAAWLLFADPVARGTFDPAPFVLTIFTAEVTAREGLRRGAVVGALAWAVIVAAWIRPGLVSVPIHLLDVALGLAIGAILLWQMRALEAEREARASERERATLAERQRIAREVHDLVAHSLSVTLLHITGARHALRDAEGGDLADVEAALADAEDVGRRAMADIRRTVSTLATEPSSTRPLPGAGEISGLVEELAGAGLVVTYDEKGDPATLDPATSLGLFRIAQESLANVAKHAPGSRTHVHLAVEPREARLTVRNALPEVSRSDGSGSGLAGMQARAEQLGAALVAGPDGGDWLVDVHLRLEQRGALRCALRPGIARLQEGTA